MILFFGSLVVRITRMLNVFIYRIGILGDRLQNLGIVNRSSEKFFLEHIKLVLFDNFSYNCCRQFRQFFSFSKISEGVKKSIPLITKNVFVHSDNYMCTFLCFGLVYNLLFWLISWELEIDFSWLMVCFLITPFPTGFYIYENVA